MVSILIRSMDRPSLQRALDSVVAQTWPSIEIVVVAASGASHRDLPPEIRGRTVRLVHAASGLPLSRPDAANLAISHVRGEWFNFLDDDDEFLPHHVETLVTASGLAAQRVRYSRTAVRDEHGHVTGHSGSPGFHAQLYFQARGTFIATMFHRSLLDEGVRFDPAFLSFQDRDFMVNCATRTAFGFVDAVTCVWNAHTGESGSGHGQNRRSTVQDTYLPMLRQKWAAAFDQWLAKPEALLFMGQHLLREQKPQQALRYLEQALADAPRDVNALNLCAMANFHVGNFARAEALLRNAIMLYPDIDSIRSNLALVLSGRRAP
ncbi:glycosyltransferase [Chiayiivirga flava]|uniref:Glycosyltransferase 2-like domain-containing protein n=1 Tax=Chiayiivirga flava TaxID=659595 RepID=A0A7W8D8F9_9GAMM|nr:glycosyltransferase [Chiayiivirga flava]MBB5208712.1 hypothetical protein [Chiayiivirga flava]